MYCPSVEFGGTIGRVFRDAKDLRTLHRVAGSDYELWPGLRGPPCPV